MVAGTVHKQQGKKKRKHIQRGFWEICSDHYFLLLLFLAIVTLTLSGVASRRTVGLIGCILCAAGLSQGHTDVTVDLWVLIPMLIGECFSAASSYATYGSMEGFVGTQAIYPVVYLFMAYLNDQELLTLRRLCALWAGAVAAVGILQFVWRALIGSAWRLGAVLGNPNALGIFLVVGWFALTSCQLHEEETGILATILRYIEPLLLAALALTLSLGSFLSMAVGILTILVYIKQTNTWKELFFFACRILAKATVGMGSGVLMYFTARRTNVPWLCVFLLVGLLAMMACWTTLEWLLKQYQRTAPVIAMCGIAVAAAVIAIRWSTAPATFAERLLMMRNGLGYLLKNPLLGIGPYQWRRLNMSDEDLYFNTWHIHNMFIHMGVELGLVVLAAMLVIVLRRFRKEEDNTGGFTAFVVHNLIDTSFFYNGITCMTMATAGNPQRKGAIIPSVIAKGIFAAFAALFVWDVL